MLCAKFCGNWPSGFGEEDENVKSLRTGELNSRDYSRIHEIMFILF